jgi:putative transposase
LKYICIEIGKSYCIGFDAICIDGDYLYFSIGAESKYSPSKVMQTIKSFISRKIFKEYSEIKKASLLLTLE